MLNKVLLFSTMIVSALTASMIRSESANQRAVLIRSARYATSAWKSRNSRKRDRRAMRSLLKKLDSRVKKSKFSGNFLHGFRLA